MASEFAASLIDAAIQADIRVLPRYHIAFCHRPCGNDRITSVATPDSSASEFAAITDAAIQAAEELHSLLTQCLAIMILFNMGHHVSLRV
jgi:hypothetical protein